MSCFHSFHRVIDATPATRDDLKTTILWYSFEGRDSSQRSQAVRKCALNVQDGGLGIALLALNAAYDLRACCLTLKICAVQGSCHQPYQYIQYITDISEQIKNKSIPKYLTLVASPAKKTRPTGAPKLIRCCGTKVGAQVL